METQKMAYGLEEAAAAIGVTRTRAYQLIQKGELRSYLDGRRRMISAKALQEYVTAKEKAAQSRAAA
jgi:excisionase family DNA binding protein